MADIEELIARARQTSGFAERRRFSLARDEALRKLRDFALADPHFYVLELVQAAIAGGARVIHADFGPRHSLFAWQGWSLSREELQHLLDYLFASHDRLELSRLRHLALGLNALRRFEPSEIVLESGDGARAHRMVLRPQGLEGMSLEVGEADQALDWTYLHAVGLRRPRGVEGRVRDEVEAIETRCLCTPVPILLGLRTPFGPKRQRIPRAWGYHPAVSFDEGDLTGTLGLAPRTGLPLPPDITPEEARHLRSEPVVRLITHGVWVQSVPLSLVPGVAIGGAVSFDRLRKTADHAAVVRDEVFSEMVVRLRPYALRLCGEPSGGVHGIRLLEGEAFAPGALGPWLRDQGRVVAISPEAAADPALAARGAALGRDLRAPIVVCPPRELPALRALAGPSVSLLSPALEDAAELAFYARPPAPPPPEPWLAAPLALPQLDTRALPARLATAAGAIRAQLFAPAEPGPAGAGVWAQVLIAERCAWEGRLPSDFAGQWLVISLPATSPGPWLRSGEGLAAALAAHVLSSAHEDQARLAARVLAGLSRGRIDCSRPLPQRLLLQALTRSAFVRFREGLAPGAPPRLTLGLLSGEEALLDLPAFACHDGARRSLRELLAGLDASGGLLYTTVAGVPADLTGLARERILELTAEGEARLLALLGSGCLCRVDRREVLAEADGVQVRDVAAGLRAYPDFPLLVEGDEPSSGAPAALLRRLVAQLRDRFLGRGAGPAQASPDDREEDRRQALRHLQWLALGGLARGGIERLDELGVADLPLLLDEANRPLTPRGLSLALLEGQPLGLSLAADLGSAELDALAAAAVAGGARPWRRPPRGVAATPFVARLLAPLCALRPSLDFDLSDAEARADPAPPVRAFLESAEVAGPNVAGRIGLPADAGVRGAVVLLDPRMRRLAELRTAAPGLVGALRLLSAQEPGEARAAAEEALEAALERLVERLVLRLGGRAEPLPAADLARAEALLLGYAGARLRLIEDAQGARMLEVGRPQAGAVLDLPLFPLGTSAGGGRVARVSGRELLGELCAFGPQALDEAPRGLAWSRARAAASPVQAAWLDGMRTPGRLLRTGRRTSPEAAALPPEPGPAKRAAHLAAKLARILHGLGADGGERVGLPLQVELKRPARHASLDDPIAFEGWELGAASCLLDGRGQACGQLLMLNREHRLVRRALADPDGGEDFHLLLLAAAGLLQAQLHTVTAEDELGFLRALCQALSAGG